MGIKVLESEENKYKNKKNLLTNYQIWEFLYNFAAENKSY